MADIGSARDDRQHKDNCGTNAASEAVKANKSLAKKLKAQNVEMDNIGGAEQATDGGLTIYVR